VNNNRFSSVEVLEMAKDIEKNGENFYRTHASHHSDPELKKLLRRLAREEEKHYNTFNELSKKSRAEEGDTNYIYDYQVSAYLEALVEYTVFPPADEIEEEVKDIDELLTIGIMAEKDSIVFYQEMLENNTGKTADILEKLIAEEKKHLMDLTNYRKELQ